MPEPEAVDHGAYCGSCRDELDAFPKKCGCGRTYNAGDWARLEFLGVMEDGNDGQLSLRNCACRSTLSVPAQHDAKASQVVFLMFSAAQMENAILRSKLPYTSTETEVEELAISISLARAARDCGLTMVHARKLFAAVAPDEARAISRLARAEVDRAAAENARRQARRS